VTAAKPEVPARARLIIEGLIRTGRGTDPHIMGAYVRLRSKIDGFYWVRIDGGRLPRGDSVDDAEQLQASFTETMDRADEPPPNGKQ
jgi:hypothetical protein